MNWHSLTPEYITKTLFTDLKKGISSKEAAQRLEKNGENTLKEQKRKSVLVRFLGQFNDFMIIILLAAAAISFAVSIIEGETDFVDPIIILIIVILNAVLGTVQESKAEKSLDALKKISAPSANVIRDGKLISVSAQDVVIGDILSFSAGDLIAADVRITSAENLCTDESALTGESNSVSKTALSSLPEDTPLAERRNMVFSSSAVTRGTGCGIVIATGMDTEVGHIADMILSAETELTPLQIRLAQVGKTLGISALIICGAVFVMGLLRSAAPFEMFMTSVSLAVAAIPEGLPAIVTIMLAIGVQRMAEKNAIIRHLPSVETLGGASVICSDKTGTLTMNKMKVTRIESSDDLFTLKLAVLCCNSRFTDKGLIGSPTENAILTAGKESGISKDDLEKKYPRLNEIPFDSLRKMMTTVHNIGGRRRIITKGAPEILLPLCSMYYDGEKIIPMTTFKRDEILKTNAAMAENALRVIAAAYKDTDGSVSETDLVFVGLIGMTDPPRPEVKEAVKLCRQAGIRPVMITGDHVITASAVARQTGILTDSDKFMTGAELDLIPQSKLEKIIKDYSVFARVTPEHKVRIVKAWKARGETVAMTGDGINDAPALKTADIGCAMGKNGTEAAKSAADMILTDDNFATIVEAVREGRGIYANIKKAVQFLLSSNIGEILTIFMGIIFGKASPLAAIQLLWVNLVTDSLPAIALGLDPVDERAMTKPPVNPKKSMFANGLGITIALEGCMIGALALLAFSIGSNIFDTSGDSIVGRSMAFAVLSLSQLVHAFNMRSEYSIFKAGILKNHYLVGAFIAGAVLQISVISVAPLADIFKVTALNVQQWGIVALLSLLPIALVELQKRYDTGMR